MATILTNILELFKKYYWQIVTASQMLIQQQLLVLVFCRKARGFTFRNISLSKFQPFDDSGPTLFICYSHPVTKYCIPDFRNLVWICNYEIFEISSSPDLDLSGGCEAGDEGWAQPRPHLLISSEIKFPFFLPNTEKIVREYIFSCNTDISYIYMQ